MNASPRAREIRAVLWRRRVAALARRVRPAHWIRSSDVGSAQCRSSKARTTGCVRAPARNHAVTAASCRRRNSSGANFAERSSGNGISTSGAIRGAYSSGSRPTRRKVFSRSARRPSSVASTPPKRCLPHSARGCRGVFCRSCEAAHSTQVCGVSAELCAKLLDQARLADAGFADDLDELTLAFERARPTARQQRKLVLAADQRRQSARPATRRPPPLARTTR